jgi:NTP pyrophosphatase (non-canonical NTP hydrolase)
MTDYPRRNAAFINAIAEEGTKAEAVEWLQKTWDELCAVRAANDNGITIGALQAAHIARQEEWCPDQKPDLSFRGNEMAGETGEACNVIKKLERERHGWRGSRDTVEHLGEELADVVHTAVLCAISAGIDLDPYVVSKFNSTSEKNGLTTRLVAA